MSNTLRRLIELYRTDPDSSFQKLLFQVRVKHERLLARIDREHGDLHLRNIRARTLLVWYRGWHTGGKIAMAHSLMSCLRVLFRFGATLLEDRECQRLHNTLSETRLEGLAPRALAMTVGQADAVRMKAHEFGWHSIALAQVLQFELLLKQKDVIGEWVPTGEIGDSDVTYRGQKWLRGLRWSDIDNELILRFNTGKRQRRIEVDLKTAPMLIDELAFLGDRREDGPIIICETTGAPYSTAEFRRKWRLVADAAGVPKNVKNMDSKPAGFIIGGPNRARISQTITPQDLNYGPRMLRE
jgi:hypothetical protein